MASCGGSWGVERRKPIFDENSPSIVAHKVVKAAARQAKGSKIASAVQVCQDQEENVVRQIRKLMPH
jgi:hypothetical protein